MTGTNIWWDGLRVGFGSRICAFDRCGLDALWDEIHRKTRKVSAVDEPEILCEMPLPGPSFKDRDVWKTCYFFIALIDFGAFWRGNRDPRLYWKYMVRFTAKFSRINEMPRWLLMEGLEKLMSAGQRTSSYSIISSKVQVSCCICCVFFIEHHWTFLSAPTSHRNGEIHCLVSADGKRLSMKGSRWPRSLSRWPW